MTKVVFISGSRSITKLSDEFINSVKKIIDLEFEIVVGDCGGIDTLAQSLLKSLGYDKVTVYFIGSKPRNNLGFKAMQVPGNRYVDKDMKMSELADYGLCLWDGRSRGTKANIDRVSLTRVHRI
jgi:hypothetical protein